MRRQLVLVMVVIVAGALLLAGAGTYVLARRGVRTDAATEVLRQAREVAAEIPPVLEVKSTRLRRGVLSVLRQTEGLHFASVSPGGSLEGGPSGVVATAVDGARLLSRGAVSGTAGPDAFAAVLVRGVTAATVPRLGGGTLVVLLVQPLPRAPLGLTYLLLVSGAALAVAATAAAVLSRRITSPLLEAVATTGRIAQGDLAARVPPASRGYPELASLTASINAMAASLARSRTHQRQFLLSVSHDLRTPLTSILGYAEAIGDGTVSDVDRAAAIIASESRRLERLVGDLLELARLDSRQFSLHPVVADVAEIARSAAEGLRRTIEEAGLSLRVAVGEGAPAWAIVDPDRVSQTVVNLVENAYKFARSEVSVWVGVAGGDVWVVVDDDGPGIAPGDQSRVFDRFYQGAVRSASRQAGSGLGLAIVAELVAAMGGAVEVSSPLATGRGTRMAVRLPARRAEGAPASSAPPQGAGAGPAMLPH